MVCVKDDDRLFLLFVGTHDHCSAWVENNRNFIPDHSRKSTITFSVVQKAPADQARDHFHTEPDYEDLLLKKITEKDLKIIFSALTNDPARP